MHGKARYTHKIMFKESSDWLKSAQDHGVSYTKFPALHFCMHVRSRYTAITLVATYNLQLQLYLNTVLFHSRLY